MVSSFLTNKCLVLYTTLDCKSDKTAQLFQGPDINLLGNNFVAYDFFGETYEKFSLKTKIWKQSNFVY